MTDNSRLRFGSTNGNPSPSKVPLARISELFDDDYTVPTGDRNHNSVPTTFKNRELQSRDVTKSDVATNVGFSAINDGAVPLASGTRGDKGCNPLYPQLCAYFFAAVLFLLGMNVSGLTLMSYPWIGNLLWYDYQNLSFHNGVIVLQFMWCGHYVRRFAEVLFVHIYRRKMSFFESVGACVYYFFFGLWVGWSVNIHLGYRVPSLVFYIPGLLFFLLGEVGNCYSHWLLRRMRFQPSGQTALSSRKRVIPTGFLFDYISYPHYFFEVITWIGFYLMAHTMAAGMFLLASSITLIAGAVKGHRQSKKEFDGEDGTPLYPPRRQAIIPFVLWMNELLQIVNAICGNEKFLWVTTD